MADRAKKISELTALTSTSGDDLLVIVDDPSGNAVTKKTTVTNFFGTVAANVNVSNAYALSANTIILNSFRTPANSTITIQQGNFFFDSNYLYIAVANNALKRIALSSF